MSAEIHPTAIVSPQAELGPGVKVMAYAVIDGEVTLGRDCVVQPFARLTGRVSAGEANEFGSGSVIGEAPQHRGDAGVGTGVIIGHHNVFRESVTVHRGTTGHDTVIGDHNYLMVGSHIAHDSHVGNHCTLANCSLVAGHVTLEDRVFLSGNCAVHQHVRIGTLALISGMSGATQDIPPFWIVQGINIPMGINVVGMRRAGIPNAEIQAVRAVFRSIYTEGVAIREAMERAEKQYSRVAAVMQVVDFVRASKRGIPGPSHLSQDLRAAA